ncbi:GDP-mannose 4,6-dehydratase [Massilia sp. B-10]|nr:GDP-mannose 4,6-dehydratase [Massilia sp. B-10]
MDQPGEFITTNINGTFTLLEAARAYWGTLERDARFVSLPARVDRRGVWHAGPGRLSRFTETTAYAPNSPYAASKAAADHLVRASHHTYGLPTLTTNCSNNYGPRQFPEKLIPLMIANALAYRHLPVYGDGLQVRDWLYVGDHCSALRAVLEKGVPGEVYNIGAACELSNLELVHALCDLLDEAVPHPGSYHDLIAHVTDRPGHDRRYAVDA